MAGDYEIVCGWIQQNQNIATETKSMCSVGQLRVLGYKRSMVSSISCVPFSMVRTLFFLISIHYCAYCAYCACCHAYCICGSCHGATQQLRHVLLL